MSPAPFEAREQVRPVAVHPMRRGDSRIFPIRAPRLLALPLLAALAAAGTACAEGARSEHGDSVDQPTVDHPEAAFKAQMDRTWELTRLGTLEIPEPPEGTPRDTPGRDLVPGRRPTLRFSQDRPGVGGRSFCNGYGGPFTLRGDSLRIHEIESSAVGCDGPDSLETRFFRGLRLTRRFRLEGDSLRLVAADGSALVFVPASP